MALTDAEETLDRCRTVADLLDDAVPVPGTDQRVGLDSILGLLPVAGDAVAGVASSYIVLEAARLGAPKTTLARMTFNVLLDFAVGSIPVLGDLFDAVFKANRKNVELLEGHLDGEDEATADDGETSAEESIDEETTDETSIEIEN